MMYTKSNYFVAKDFEKSFHSSFLESNTYYF